MRDYHDTIQIAKETAERIVREKGLNYEYSQGFIQGYVEGYIEGYFEAKIQIGRNLKASGIDLDTIVQLTGLDRDAVEKL